jgi:hypothetical protein
MRGRYRFAPLNKKKGEDQKRLGYDIGQTRGIKARIYDDVYVRDGDEVGTSGRIRD